MESILPFSAVTTLISEGGGNGCRLAPPEGLADRLWVPLLSTRCLRKSVTEGNGSNLRVWLTALKQRRLASKVCQSQPVEFVYQAGFATSLSGDGRTLAVGAIQDGNGGAGYVRVYRYSSASEDWQQIGEDLVGVAAGVRFGFAVSISNDGTRIIVGDPDDFDTEGELRGHARVFSIEPTCLSDPPTATPIAQKPTKAPTGPPLISGTRRQAQFEGIRLDFVGVDALSVSEKTIFQDVHKQ